MEAKDETKTEKNKTEKKEHVILIQSVKKKGSTITVSYSEGKDERQLQSHEKPAKAFDEAWDNLALDYKTLLAGQLGVAPDRTQAFCDDHQISFEKVKYGYGCSVTPALFEIWGHHKIVGTNYDTDVHFNFLVNGRSTPSKPALAILEEAKKYVQGRRNELEQTSLDFGDTKVEVTKLS